MLRQSVSYRSGKSFSYNEVKPLQVSRLICVSAGQMGADDEEIGIAMEKFIR